MLKGHPVPGKTKSSDIIEAFIAGAPPDARGNVFFGVTAGNRAAWDAARASEDPFWFIDNSYFDAARGRQFRVTRNRLQHMGDGASDGKRFRALGVMVHPLRPPKPAQRIALVLPQSTVFFVETVQGDSLHWCDRAAARYAALDGWRVVVRPWDSDKLALSRTLGDDLADASLLVTHSSAGAVTALLSGVPVRVSPVSCAYRFDGRLEDVEREEVVQWASVLADSQWSLDEFRDGTAWRMLHRG